MIEDAALLRRYAAEKSEDAFAELVRRRVGLVYSVALRQVGGDAHLAEDVTQRVFADLGRKAAALSERAVLSGWLYRSAQFAASDLVRAERRRRAREEEAQTMNEPFAVEAAIDWEKVRPVLDETLGELADEDRDAVALRFFENRPFAEIGEALDISEDTARKRVDRALDKLHALLARRGVTSTTAALSLALANQAGVAAPVGLAASVTGAALAGTVAQSLGLLTLMAKTTSTVVLGGLALVGAGFALYLYQANAGMQEELEALRADQTQTSARLRAKDESLKKSAAALETARVERGELERLRAQVAAAKAVQAPPARPAPIVGGRVIESFTNAGRATPTNAFESYFWALNGGEIKSLADVIVYDEKAFAIFKTIFADLSEPARTFYGSPLVMAAAVGGSMSNSPLKKLEVAEEPGAGPDEMVLRYKLNDDERVRTIPVRRFPDGWRIVGRGAMLMDAERIAMFRTMAEGIAAGVKK